MIQKTARLIPFLPLILASCAGQGAAKETTADYPEEGKTACYRYAENRDTILLTLKRTGDAISGELIYKLYEKDRNTGTITGVYDRNTVNGDYTFMSEGVTSKRKFAMKFLPGDVVIDGDENLTLHRVDCKAD